MISEKEYKLLLLIRRNKTVNRSKHINEIKTLYREKKIKHTADGKGYIVDTPGDRAIEEYEEYRKTQKSKRWADFRAWITLVVAVITLIISVISLLKA